MKSSGIRLHSDSNVLYSHRPDARRLWPYCALQSWPAALLEPLWTQRAPTHRVMRQSHIARSQRLALRIEDSVSTWETTGALHAARGAAGGPTRSSSGSLSGRRARHAWRRHLSQPARGASRWTPWPPELTFLASPLAAGWNPGGQLGRSGRLPHRVRRRRSAAYPQQLHFYCPAAVGILWRTGNVGGNHQMVIV